MIKSDNYLRAVVLNTQNIHFLNFNVELATGQVPEPQNLKWKEYHI